MCQASSIYVTKFLNLPVIHSASSPGCYLLRTRSSLDTPHCAAERSLHHTLCRLLSFDIFIIMLSTSSSRVVSHGSREFTPGDAMCTWPGPMPCVLTLETVTTCFDQSIGTYWSTSSTPCGGAEGDHTPEQGQCQGGVWSGGFLLRCFQVSPADSNGVSHISLLRHWMLVSVR